MPKLKDLGVKVLPDTMRPPEIGGGGPLTECPGSQCANTWGMSALCGVAAAAAICPGFTACACTVITNPCLGCTHFITVCPHASCACSVVASICTGGSHTIITIVTTTPQIAAGGGLTREHIASLRTQLQEQLQQLEQAEKDQIDARQKQVEDELAQLKQRRKDLK